MYKVLFQIHSQRTAGSKWTPAFHLPPTPLTKVPNVGTMNGPQVTGLIGCRCFRSRVTAKALRVGKFLWLGRMAVLDVRKKKNWWEAGSVISWGCRGWVGCRDEWGAPAGAGDFMRFR